MTTNFIIKKYFNSQFIQSEVVIQINPIMFFYHRFQLQFSQDLTTGLEHFLWLHFCFRTFLPPYLGLSKQYIQVPQSGLRQPEHLRQGQSLCCPVEHFISDLLASSSSLETSANPCFFTKTLEDEVFRSLAGGASDFLGSLST